MDFEAFKKLVKMSIFLPEYAGIEYTPMTRHKMRGKDGHKNDIDFTEKEYQQIQKGAKRLAKELKSFPEGK